MKVFKFGGASVKDAEAVKNLLKIVEKENDELIIIVSAMGKTTNSLEVLHKKSFLNEDFNVEFEELKKYHFNIIKNLSLHNISKIEKTFDDLFMILKEAHRYGKEFTYAQVVSYGELISTLIVSEFLNQKGKSNTWVDARKCIQTDNNWIEGNVNWEFTKTFVKQFTKEAFQINNCIITQGFIGSNADGHVTTLGREGSDFSAAIFAKCLDAISVTVWKDVDGILSGDPKLFSDVEKFDQLSYRETIEMAFYGASVIHPKTIKPLSEKNIPLYVRSFLNLENEGTTILEDIKHDPLPSFIIKNNQCLITFANNDLSFTNETSFGEVFTLLSTLNTKINLIQSSATSFSVCIDFNQEKIDSIIERLSSFFTIHYNSDLELLTIKNYNENALNKIDLKSKNVFLEQRTRKNTRILYKK